MEEYEKIQTEFKGGKNRYRPMNDMVLEVRRGTSMDLAKLEDMAVIGLAITAGVEVIGLGMVERRLVTWMRRIR